MRKHSLVVTGAEREWSLGALVARRLGLDPEVASFWITCGSVYVDGRRRLDPRMRIEPGHRVTIHEPRGEAAEPQQPGVAYEDRFLVVLDKPAELACTLPREGCEQTLEGIVRQRYGPGARLLHRLDRQVSGLVVASRRSGPSRRGLSQQISRHRMRRLYFALVQGRPPLEQMVLDAPLTMERGLARPSQDRRARQALTHVRLLCAGEATSLLQVEPLTGRTHQIRAHLALAGLALWGDTRYGGPPGERLGLHAHCVRLRHPTGGLIEVHSPLPADLRCLLYPGCPERRVLLELPVKGPAGE